MASKAKTAEKKAIPRGDDWDSFLWGGKAKKRVVPTRRGETKYSIKGGDTLSALAKKNGTTLGAIRRANPGRFPTAASLNKIKVGEKINMPPNVKASTPYDVKAVRKTTTPPTPKPKPSRKTKQDIKDEASEVRAMSSMMGRPEIKEEVGRSPGDPFSEDKRAAPSRKPTGPEVFWERAKRARAAKAKTAEQKAITRSRAGRDTGIGAGRKAAQRELKPREGGIRYADLPEWLGGGQIKIDSSDEAMNTSYPGEEYKKGGRLKKSVKKAKAKPRKAKAKTRKRAALRGHGAELRGG